MDSKQLDSEQKMQQYSEQQMQQDRGEPKCRTNFQQKRSTFWVEARVLPSGLKAAAIVERGAGSRVQYFAVQWRRDSVSNLMEDQTPQKTFKSPMKHE
jgi:hypothetical protein